MKNILNYISFIIIIGFTTYQLLIYISFSKNIFTKLTNFDLKMISLINRKNLKYKENLNTFNQHSKKHHLYVLIYSIFFTISSNYSFRSSALVTLLIALEYYRFSHCIKNLNI
ncbi:hypothetical protein ACFIJ5_18175 (plasmid) [Haloimpatiens sp. FM7330]|uniref:hypothetical protein n=1 Tax=Haloimpatiens sp. FM7330 TaxID=3298610 RepID=UPI00363F6744